MGVHGYTGTVQAKIAISMRERDDHPLEFGETSQWNCWQCLKAPAKPLTDILWYTWFLVPLGQNHCTYHGLTPYPGCKWKWTLNFFWRRLGQPFFCPLMLVQCCTGNRFHLGKVEKKTWCWLVIWAVKNPESTVGEWMAKLNCQDSRSSKFGCFDLVTLFTMFVAFPCSLFPYLFPHHCSLKHHIHMLRTAWSPPPACGLPMLTCLMSAVGASHRWNCAKWSATQGGRR